MNPCTQVEEIKEIKEEINGLKIANMGFSKDIQALCGKLDSLVVTLDKISQNMGWVVKTVLGAVILAVLVMLFK